MKEWFNNKKIIYGLIIVLVGILLFVGVTYAWWVITKPQSGTNVIGTACLNLDLTNEANNINLTSQLPISDEEGMALTPYTFTIKNNCSTSVDYQINLESLGDSSSSISSSALRVALGEEHRLLSEYGEADTTISNAYESHRIAFGTLAANGSATYNLRIWLDYDATTSENSKSFTSKISVTAGQGIVNPYKQGTLAYDILENHGGIESIIHKPLAISGMVDGITEFELNKKMLWGTEYDFDYVNNKIILSGNIVKATVLECRETTGLCGSYTFNNLENSASASGYIYMYNSGYTAFDVKAFITYTASSTASDNFLYKTKDDLGDSYYFRGSALNNYVVFGEWQETVAEYIPVGYEHLSYPTYEECMAQIELGAPFTECSEKATAIAGDLMYWRIVRINGDGTIRLVYDGTDVYDNGTAHIASIANSQYSTNRSDSKYVGYTYNDNGTQVNSTIKTVIDKWYENNLKNNYGKYISDGIFCNDKQTLSSTADYFSSSNRITPYGVPTLKCNVLGDRYTTNSGLGNGLLTYPVGLLSADEVAFAGASVAFGTPNSSFYLYSGENFATLTPYVKAANEITIWSYNDTTFESTTVALSDLALRPVINLKADVKFTGEGTKASPYEIVIE